MKILHYQKRANLFRKSGVGRAMAHQQKALSLAGVDVVSSPKDDYDIVHLNTLDPASLFMAKKAHRKNKKVVFHAHTTIKDFRRSFFLSNLVQWPFLLYLKHSYKSADLLLTPSVYSKSVLDTYNLKRPIKVISNGIDLEKYALSESKIESFRNYFNIKPDQKVIISVGYYFERKGFHDFIEIASKLPQYTFIWFGYSTKIATTRVVRKALRHVPKNVILPGYISGDILEGAWLCADLFFFPSYEETEGIVVLEALASKCPVLVRDIEVYDSWLKDKVSCYKGHNNEKFHKLIIDIVEKTLPSTTEAGYEVACERSLSIIGEKLKTIYENLLK